MARLAPTFMASLIMGAWFYMTAVGNFVAGKIGEATGGHDGEMTKEATLSIYNTIGWVTLGVAVAVLAVSPFVRKLMHLDTLRDDDLAGQKELAEPIAPGLRPQDETRPDGRPKRI
jgi:POT family proton-dependent oligopeptide transporter